MERYLNILELVLTVAALATSWYAVTLARHVNDDVADALEDMPSKKEARELISEMSDLLEKFYRDQAADRMRRRRAKERTPEGEETESGTSHEGGGLVPAGREPTKAELWAIVHQRGLSNPNRRVQ